MNPQQRNKFRAEIEKHTRNATHYIGCSKDHPWCMAEDLLDAYEELLEQIISDAEKFLS